MLTILLAPAIAAENWAPGEEIDEAAGLHLTKAGLDAVTELIPALLPAEIAVPDMYDEAGYIKYCLGYWYSLSNAWVGIEVVDATITPANGRLDIHADLLVNVNDASDKFQLSFEALCIETNCPGYVEPFPVTVDTSVALEVVKQSDGTKALDATMGEVVVGYSDLTDSIKLDCWIGDVEEVLGYLGLSLYDLIFGLVESSLKDAIADFGPELETTIEEAFSAATIEQELDLNGVTMTISLHPDDVKVTPAGVSVIMAGSMTAAESACVVDNIGGSTKTKTAMPELEDIPGSAHAGLLLSDDIANQALYSLWRGGLLCYTLQGDDPLPVNSSLLSLFAGDTFDEVIPEVVPMVITTRPKLPPTGVFNGSHDLEVDVQDLGLDFHAEVDGRMAKVMALELDTPVGIDLPFDGSTGALNIVVDLDPAKVSAVVTHDELVAGSEATIEASFGSGLESILDAAVKPLLEGLSFTLPAMEGVGLKTLDVEPAGKESDWLGAYATLGSVSYAGGDCGGCGGGSSSDCSGGCTAQNVQSKAFWMVFPLALVALRRRK